MNDVSSRWNSPTNLDSPQQYLFGAKTNDVMAALRVSADDAHRWYANGWLSYDVSQKPVIDPPLEAELRFITSVARSGLPDSLIHEMLKPLSKPYRFDPEAIAYSFIHRWVEAPRQPDPSDVIEENVEEWLEDLVDREEFSRLRKLHDRISELLDREANDERDNEQRG